MSRGLPLVTPKEHPPQGALDLAFVRPGSPEGSPQKLPFAPRVEIELENLVKSAHLAEALGELTEIEI